MTSLSNYPTQQQKNGFKLQLLREKSEKQLRKLFHKKFPTDPTKLNVELQKHQRPLKQLLKKKVLKQDQYDVLFPASKKPDSEKFDATLLFLLVRTLCGYKQPSTGWDTEPDVIDTTEIANAIRLKLGRNRIQHGNVSISTTEYNGIYRYLRQPLLDLGCPKTEIDNLMVSFRYDIPTQSDSFVGREDELDDLDKAFNVENRKKLAAIISGIPGIGKSEVARQYCHQNNSIYDHIVWINADSSLKSTYVDIAKILQLHEKSTTKVIAKLLQEYFKDDKVLFIFDNCTDIKVLSDVLFQNHDNIITTQIKHWANCYEVIPLDVWTPENARQYLKKCNLGQEQNLLEDLMKELGHHPLGIQHAVAFIVESHISVADYLDCLKKQPLDVLMEKVELDQGVPRSVLASFLITIEKLKREKPETFELLSIMGVLDASLLNEEYLEHFYENKLDYVKAKKTLLQYSMVQHNERMIEFLNEQIKYLTIHSLYQLSIKHYMIEFGDIKKAFNKCFEMIVKISIDIQNTDMEIPTTWIRQFIHLWKQEDFQQTVMEKLNLKLLFIWNKCFPSFGNYKFVIKMVNKVVEARKINLKDPVYYFARYLQIIHCIKQNEKNNLLEQMQQFNLNDLPEVFHSKDTQQEMEELLIQVNNNLNNSADIDFLKECIRKFISGKESLKKELDMLEEGIYSNKSLNLFQGFNRGIVSKEMKRYNEAIEIFSKYPDYYDTYAISKVQIGCCYILQGNEKLGMEIIKSVKEFSNHENSLLDVGRAYFGVGLYKESKYNFLKISWKLLRNSLISSSPNLDGFCKMSILKVPVEWSAIPLSGNRNFLFRTFSLLLIISIRNGDLHNINNVNIPHLINPANRLRIREPLIMAYHLKKRHEYYKAMLIYQLIERMQNQFSIPIHESLVDMQLDIQEEIKICFQSLRRIFKF